MVHRVVKAGIPGIRRALRRTATLVAVISLCLSPVMVSARVPNDSYFTELWQLQHVGAPDAWNISLGMETVPVAVIDSGVDLDHPDLKDNIWRNVDEVAHDGIDNDNNGYVDDAYGWDFVDHDSDPNPKIIDGYTVLGANHGTISAGLISAKGDNGRGIVGMTWQAPIMALRALDSYGIGDPLKVARAVDYAVDNGAKVINLSFAGTTYNARLADSLRRAYDRGVFVVAAAGNAPEGGSAINLDREPIYPVCYDLDANENFVYGVAATDSLDRKAGFSNYGAGCVDISAPGTRILSTQLYIPGHESFSEPYGGYYNGTSVAAPLVSGLAALVRALDPKLTPKQVQNIFLETSFNIHPQNPDYFGLLGRGRIEAAKAVVHVRKGPEPPPPVATSASLLPDDYEDGIIIAASGPGRESEVRLFTESGVFIRGFSAFPGGFQGGVSLAIGNFDGTNKNSIVAGALAGGGPQVRIFDINTRAVGGFYAYDHDFRGGVEVAAGDMNGNGEDEIITGAGPGGGPHVRMFDKRGVPLGGFFAYDQEYRGGVSVASADIDGDSLAEIIVVPGKGKADVRVFDHTGDHMFSFMPFGTRYDRGMRVDAEDIDGDGDIEIIVRGTGSAGETRSALFDGKGELLGEVENGVPTVGLSALGPSVESAGTTSVWGVLPGAVPQVTVSVTSRPALPFLAFEPAFTGGVRAVIVR
ncbi:MAG: S8 family serine peptidase [Patescibacteria group bacterium]|nr:S8 family serine peptidase [Patescibacteria group bacterium]